MASNDRNPKPFEPLAVYEIEQVAEKLHVDDKTVRALIKRQELQAKKVGKAYKMLGEDVLRFMGNPTLPTMKTDSHLEDLENNK